MHRRRLIQALGVGLSGSITAGCLEAIGTEAKPVEYHVEPIGYEQSDRPVEYSVGLTNGTLGDPDAPAAIDLGLRNTSPDEGIVFGERRSALFHGVKDATDRYWLIPGTHPDAREKHSYEFAGRCWKETDGPKGLVGNGYYGCGRLDAGETIHQPLLVLQYAKDESCPADPPEELSFTSGVKAATSGSCVDVSETDRYDWGFTIVRD